MADTSPQQDMLSGAGMTETAGAAAVPAAPTAEPPAAAISSGGVTAGGIGASTWVNNKKINALWSINENRNSWVGVAGVGWVKLANNSDSAIVAFTMLGANARQTQGNVNYRQESDNMIHEMYVW
ncbi:MAG: hypothetical protein JSR90_02465 [Proteobacteria bacterium]|nr:hypothetical protein [Pseudomonadota bacterium]